MSYMYRNGWVLCASFLMLVSPAIGQTFNITGRTTTGASFRLDETNTVTYTVTSSGSTQPVVPLLRVTDSNLAQMVSITWTGESAVTIPSGGTTLVFKVHPYDNANLCGQTVTLELLLYSSQFSGSVTATTANSSLMQFSTSGTGQINLHTELSSTQDDLPFPLSGSSPTQYFLRTNNVSQTIINDPTNRIYFWCDYSLPSWSQVFAGFFYEMNNNNCALFPEFDLAGQGLVQGDVIDQTSGTPRVVTQAPLGGAGTGPTLGTGINIFDVTDVNPAIAACASTVRASISYPTGSYSLAWQFVGGGSNAIVRRFALYVGNESGCDALAFNFGDAPATAGFDVENFFIDSNGNVQATLDVPDAWGSATTLTSAYRVKWYLRRDNMVMSLGAETQSLALNAASGLTISDPGNYYLEARVRRVDNSATVSTSSRAYNHALAYTLNPLTFQRAEQVSINGASSDEYLDAGEILSVPLQMVASAGGNLPTLSFNNGVVIDTNANSVIDASDTFLETDTPSQSSVNIRFAGLSNSGGTATTTLTSTYELLTAEVMPRVWFYSEVTRTDPGGTLSTYRRYVSLVELLGGERDLNAQNSLEIYNYNFTNTAGSGWTTDATNFDTGATVVPSGGLGWAHATGWNGQGGSLAATANHVYRLTSPALPLGTDTVGSFTHLPQFSFNQSGGLLEYRVKTGANSWTTYASVDSFCANCDYNSFTFPSSPTSYLSGKKVWMSNESSARSATLQGEALENLGAIRDEIQFRYTFQDPSLVDTGRSDGPTHWNLSSFNYQTTHLAVDNIFGVDLTQLSWDACAEPGLVFNGNAPIAIANLAFEWYESLQDLYDDVAVGPVTGSQGAAVPFEPTTNGTYNYYARISYLGTERIIPVTVIKTEPCLNICYTREEAIERLTSEASTAWPFEQSVLNCVQVVNRICKPSR